MGFALGLHGLKPGFAWFQIQDKPAKNRVYFLTPPNRAESFHVARSHFWRSHPSVALREQLSLPVSGALAAAFLAACNEAAQTGNPHRLGPRRLAKRLLLEAQATMPFESGMRR
jgi:hypothetical protein